MKGHALFALALVATLAAGCGRNDRADIGANNAIGTSGDELRQFGPDGTTPNRTDNVVSMAINEWATTMLPTTKKHLDTAKQIAGVE